MARALRRPARAVDGLVELLPAAERGLDENDWLAGDVLYKRQLSTPTRELVWADLS